MAPSIGRGVTLVNFFCRRHIIADLLPKVAATQVRCRASKPAAADKTEDAVAVSAVDDVQAEEERLQEESMCNISGLTGPQRRRIHGQVPEIRNEYQETVRYQRRLYGKFGKASGVDPRVIWPTKQKAIELTELNQEWEPPLPERLEKLRAGKEFIARKLQEREQRVARNMAKMDQWIAEYRQKLAKKDSEAKAKEDKKRQLLEEAREYFGYYVDPRDAKFQEMLEEKEKKDKELAKKKKKEKRLERLTANLQHMAEEAEEKS